MADHIKKPEPAAPKTPSSDVLRRIATRNDKRSDNVLSAALLAAAVMWWMPIESRA